MQKSIFFIFNDNKANQPAQRFAIVIFLYLKWSSIVVQGTRLCNNRDKNVDLHNFFISVKMIYLTRLPIRRSYMLKKMYGTLENIFDVLRTL